MGNTPSDLNNNNQKKETYKIKVPEKENNNEQKKNNIDTINCNIPEYHQTHRIQVDTGIQNYQYFKPKVNNQSIIGKIGIDTKSDNKYSFDINTLYENEKNYRRNTDCSREYTYTKDKFKKDLGQNSNNYESEYTKKYNPDRNYREENNTKTYEEGYHLKESNHNNSNDYYNSQNNQYYSNYQDDNSNLSITREDAIAIRDFKYLDNLEKRLLILNNITLYNLDPLDIQSKEKIELSKLIEKYTSLRNIYHPDKGGNTTMFILINNALTNQKYIQNSKIIDKDHNSLKNDYDEYRVNEKKKKPISETFIKNFDNEKFNNFYNTNKFNDEFEEEGYGEQMIKSGIREDIEIEKVELEKNCTFNEYFDSITKKTNNKIIEYSVPVAIDYNNYKILGTKCNKYTGKGNQIMYSDYIEAFSSSGVNSGNYQEKNIDYESYKKNREEDPLELSDYQKNVIESLDNKNKDEEADRLLRLDRYNSEISKHYNNTHKVLLEYS